jgi:PPOX class probable F420-dependent enzyme
VVLGLELATGWDLHDLQAVRFVVAEARVGRPAAPASPTRQRERREILDAAAFVERQPSRSTNRWYELATYQSSNPSGLVTMVRSSATEPQSGSGSMDYSSHPSALHNDMGEDMTMTPEEERFLKGHRFCVASTLRKDGAPQSTPVYYLYDGGLLYISVTETRKKTLNVARDGRVSVCALAEEWPFDYVQVMGTARITKDDLVETSRRIWSTFRPQLPDDFAQMMVDQQRVLMVVTPERVTSRLQAPAGR